LRVGDSLYKIDYLIRSNRRSVSITISPKCEVIVKAPRSLAFSQIEAIVAKRDSWIRLHIEQIRSTQKVNSDILNYNDMLFLGNVYHITFDDKIKNITLEPNYCVVPARYNNDVTKQLVKWYKKTAHDILTKRVEYFSVLMQLKPNLVKLTNAKTCWGVCNSLGVVSLNWRLILLPHDLIDYVVVHELSHLVQMNHSKLFWQLVESVLPDYATRRKNLKKGGYLLSLFR